MMLVRRLAAWILFAIRSFSSYLVSLLALICRQNKERDVLGGSSVLRQNHGKKLRRTALALSMTGGHSVQKTGATSLMYACQQGKASEVISIINSKPNSLKERERTLKTALHYCAESGEGGVASAAALLTADPTLVSAQDQDGYSALHLAVIAGNIPLATLLLDRGAPINLPDNEGHSCAHWATVCGEIDSLNLLVSRGVEINSGDMHGGRPLHYAAQMCGPASDMPAPRGLGMAALRILLAAGADPNLPDNHGRQPILWAASAGSPESILVLVGAGANVQAADKDGLTALHCAASRGHADCVETLIALCNAEVDLIDHNGCSALFYAVTLGHSEATLALLDHKAATNRHDRKGRTAIHCGAAKGQLETVKAVAERGGNLWSRTARGDQPIHDAVASGRRQLVIWLLADKPQAVMAPNNDGRTPLHVAAIHNNIDMCKTLLDAGSLINPVMRTSKGTLATPLDAALRKGHRACAKYLQLHGGVPASRLDSRTAGLCPRPPSFNQEVNAQVEGQGSSGVADKRRVEDVKPPSSPLQLKETETSRPRLLKVYVEDDVMIRRIRHHEGSDSSIEERVRRRRRKRKTRILSARERSIKREVIPESKGSLSTDETIESGHMSETPTLLEKDVQTDIALQLQTDSVAIQSIDRPKHEEIVKKTSLESLENDPNAGKHLIVEAVVHKVEDTPVFEEGKTDEKDDSVLETQEVKADGGEQSEIKKETITLEKKLLHDVDEESSHPNEGEPRSEKTIENDENNLKIEQSDPLTEENPPVPPDLAENTLDPPNETTDDINAPSESIKNGTEEPEVSQQLQSVHKDDEKVILDQAYSVPAEKDETDIVPNGDLGQEETSRIVVENGEKDLALLENIDSQDISEDTVISVEHGGTSQILEDQGNENDDLNSVNDDQSEVSHLVQDLSAQSTTEDPSVSKEIDKDDVEEQIRDSESEISEGKGLIKVLDSSVLLDESVFKDDRRKRSRKKRENGKRWRKERTVSSFEVVQSSLLETKWVAPEQSPKTGIVDSGIEPSPRKEKFRLTRSRDKSKIPRACKKNFDSINDTLSTVSVTQAVQYSVRKYQMERRIFYQLLELKRVQIRAGRANEAVLVKRLVDDYKRSGLAVGLSQYDGVYTFRSFEKYLYEQLRLLQSSEKRIIPRLKSSDDLERLTETLRKTRVGQEILASVPNNPALCTFQTNKCHHATHAYTGIPCAAYIKKENHHTMPKPGFLPRLVDGGGEVLGGGSAEVAKTLRYVDPSRPLTLELTHGPDKQVITLPTERLDKSKKYFVTFTIKSGEKTLNKPVSNAKHTHATSI